MATWTGPNDEDYGFPQAYELKAPVPGERWPYGPPESHDDACNLQTGGLFCDCFASDASDDPFGEV